MLQATTAESSFLSQMRLFSDAEPEALDDLIPLLKLRRYRKGETIFHEDDPPGSLFLVKSGLVKVQLNSNDDKHITIAWVRPHNFFGTLSCVKGMPRPEAAVALEPTETFVLDREDFRVFLQRHPETALVFIDLLAERWQSGLELLQDVAFREVPARLAKVLLRSTRRTTSLLTVCDDRGTCFQSPSQTELAGLVGATRESVNKWMQRFVQQGAISYDGRYIRLLDSAVLNKYLN